MDGVVTWFTDGAPVQALHEQVWIDPLNSRYKVEWADKQHGSFFETQRWLYRSSHQFEFRAG